MKRGMLFPGVLVVMGLVYAPQSRAMANLAVDKQGKTDLMRALAAGNSDQARELINAQPDTINMADNNGRTALMYAANWLHLDIAALLEARGADATRVDNEGHDAFFYALRRSPFVGRTDLKGALLFDLGAVYGEYYACAGGCTSRKVLCRESKPFCIGEQCGFWCKTIVWRVEGCYDSCKPNDPSTKEEEMSLQNTIPATSWMRHSTKPVDF
jgi:Ankyrin repeats (3 copies)